MTTQTDPSPPVGPRPAEPLSGRPTVEPALSIPRCFDDAGSALSRNLAVLVVAALVFQLLSLVSLLILCGPLCGGAALLSLRCLLRPDRRAELGDLFGTMHRFLPMAGLFFLTLLATIAGLVALVVPGLLLMALWLFPYYLMVDKNVGVMDALTASAAIVRRRGFGPNFLLAMIVLALAGAPSLIPYVGFLIACFTIPLTWLLVASAYVQQVRERPEDLADLFPRGFPVATAA